MPFEGYWILLVFNASKKESNHSGAWIFQIAISTDSNNKALYFRRNINYKESGWETWRTISATFDNIEKQYVPGNPTSYD